MSTLFYKSHLGGDGGVGAHREQTSLLHPLDDVDRRFNAGRLRHGRGGCGACARRNGARVLYISGVLALAAVTTLFIVIPATTPYDPAPHNNRQHPPDAPRPPTHTMANSTAITLAWLAPNARTAAIIRYEAQVGQAPKQPGRAPMQYDDCCTSRLPSCTAGQLLGGRRFCFRVRAVSSVGAGRYSNASCFETLPPDVPEAVVSILPRFTTGSSISIEWPASNNNGAVVDMYELSTTPHGKGAWATHPECATGLGCAVKMLRAGAQYDFRARAHNSVGWGQPGPVFSYHTNKVPAAVPGMPAGLRIASVAESAITVAWLPGDDGGAQLLNYTVEVSQQAGGGTTLYPVPLNLLQASPELTVPSLRSLEQYCFRARSTNSIGHGAWCELLCAKTGKPLPPNAPLLFPTPVRTGAGSLTVAWQRPDNNAGLAMAYELQKDDYWTAGPLAPIWKGAATNFTADVHLLPATAYNFRVRGISSAGTGAWSQTHNFTTDRNGKCGNPADVAAYRRTKKTMKPQIQGCLIACKAKGQGEECIVECIHTKVGLSSPCAACWYFEGQCTLKNCLAPCLSPGSQACQTCSEEKCFPDCVACSGIPRYFFPP